MLSFAAESTAPSGTTWPFSTCGQSKLHGVPDTVGHGIVPAERKQAIQPGRSYLRSAPSIWNPTSMRSKILAKKFEMSQKKLGTLLPQLPVFIGEVFVNVQFSGVWPAGDSLPVQVGGFNMSQVFLSSPFMHWVSVP